MQTNRELEDTRLLANRKIEDIMDSRKEFTADDLRNLQTLYRLREAAEEKLARRKDNE